MKSIFSTIIDFILSLFSKSVPPVPQPIDHVEPIVPVPVPTPTPISDWHLDNSIDISHAYGNYPPEKKHILFVMAQDVCKEKNMTPELSAELLATIFTESNWNPYAINENKDINGNVVSTDFGISQLNSFWYLRPRNMTGDEAMNNPKLCLEIMADSFNAGRADDWVSHKTGAYRNYIGIVV